MKRSIEHGYEAIDSSMIMKKLLTRLLLSLLVFSFTVDSGSAAGISLSSFHDAKTIPLSFQEQALAEALANFPRSLENNPDPRVREAKLRPHWTLSVIESLKTFWEGIKHPDTITAGRKRLHSLRRLGIKNLPHPESLDAETFSEKYIARLSPLELVNILVRPRAFARDDHNNSM